MSERAAKLTILLGANGTGKTTLLEQILKQSNQRALIITPDDIEWQQYPHNELSDESNFAFTGIERHIYRYDTLQRVACFTSGILIFDDCRAYLKSNIDIEIHNLLIRRRQRMVDIFAVGHGFTEVPPKFFTFATDIILFRTADNIQRRKDCLKDFERIVEMQKFVNNYAADKDPHCFEHFKFS
jgi:ABC-type sugar transport system ATPase subunit